MEAARLRLRPILMTSFAFILGVTPLLFAGGPGGASRRSLGTAVFGGMNAATLLAIFIVPVLFVVIQRNWSSASRSLRPASSPWRSNPNEYPLLLALPLLLAGCRLGPNYKRPAVPVPGTYRGSPAPPRPLPWPIPSGPTCSTTTP